MALQDYDILPRGMRAYLRNYGRHFSRRACEYAVAQMKEVNDAGRLVRIDPITKEQLDELLTRSNITLERNRGYDYVYVANMCRADFFRSSVPDEAHLALYVKDVIDDPDAAEGFIFNRWLADCDTANLAIDWEDLI